jgi:hypothetical protein
VEVCTKTSGNKESNQAALGASKKEMNELRMAESTREEDVSQTARQELEKRPRLNVGKSAGGSSRGEQC